MGREGVEGGGNDEPEGDDCFTWLIYVYTNILYTIFIKLRGNWSLSYPLVPCWHLVHMPAGTALGVNRAVSFYLTLVGSSHS